MAPPLVSVIIPVKNGERFLASAIQSVLEQDYPCYEIIVVDGQSKDRTATIAKSSRLVRYLYQHGESGIATARNLGIQAAKGELVAFLSHDDLWAPNKLSSQVDFMTHHPEVQYTITRVKFILAQGCSIPRGFRQELLDGDYVGRMSETLVARRSLFNCIGGFNPDFVVNEDTEWFARTKDNDVLTATIPAVLVFKRIHEENISLSRIGVAWSNETILRIAKESIERKRRQLEGGAH
jgi:glycosyltransferase involved in cell wall biosynthesis